MVSRSGESARTLILIGLILQAVEVLVAIGVGAFLLIVPILGVLILTVAFFGLIWVALVYLFSYAAVRAGEYEDARTPTLVFAILSLLTGSLIPGVLYIVAWVKLGDAPPSEQRD